MATTTTATDSRLGPGTLKFGTLGVEAQVSAATLTPKIDETEGVATLANPTPVADVKTSWTIKGETISDWEDAAGFVQYCFDNSGASVEFVFVPNTAAGASWSGTCQVRAIEIGGKVSEQSVVTFEFPLVGLPVRADGAAPLKVVDKAAA
jgi:hypothetical protein